MRTLIIGFVVFLLYAVPARWHYVCKIRNLCEDKPTTTANTTENVAEIPNRTKDLSLMNGDSTILANYDQFGFLPNSAILQLTDNNKAYLKGIADYLTANPDARLGIIGYYFPDEKMETVSVFDNLGLARAAAIRDYMVNTYNFDENRFKLDHELVQRGNREYLDKPLAYNIILTNDDDVKARGGVALEEASYTFNRMTFSDINFEYNSIEFKPSQSFVTYADSVKTYLEKNKGKTLTIVGHTDSDGQDEYNYGLANARANNVIIFLRDKTGIEVKLMMAKSEGEKKPIAPNDTDLNKRKNRRVEMIIK